MKIVYMITLSDPIGGAQVHLLDLVTFALKQGHEVEVYIGQEGTLTDALKTRGIKCTIIKNLVRSISPIKDLFAIYEIMRALSNSKPDIFALHSSKAGWLGRISGFLCGVPSIFTAHGWAFTEGVRPFARYFYILAERFVAKFCKRIITVSDYDFRLAIKNSVSDVGRLITVHNGVVDIPSTLYANPSKCPAKMIMIARHQVPKDHSTLFRALAQLQDISWQLDLVGDGPLLQKSKELACELGIEDRIAFLGAREDIPELISRSQILILVSNFEGFPLCILEAMRAKLPVIASDVGGCCESVKDGINGFLVPRGCVETLADRLELLLGNPDLRYQLGSNGRIIFEEEFTFEKMYKKTIAVYEKAMK